MEERADDRRWNERLWLLGTGLVAIGCGFAVLFVTGDAGGGLIALGILIAAFGAVVYRAVSFKLTARGIEADLSGRPSGRAFVKAAAQASDGSLAAMIPLLFDDVDCATGVLVLPARYDGLCLNDGGDPGLTWIRQTWNVQVFAVKFPGESTWLGGGRITELPLRTGTELAVSGTSEEITRSGRGSGRATRRPIAMTSARPPSRA